MILSRRCADMDAVIGVSVRAGHMTLQVTLAGPASRAMPLLNAITAPFAAA
jgi:hypothetical protein